MREILQHLETRIQHEFVVVSETGKILRKVVDEPQVVTPEEWPSYYRRFLAGMRQTQKELDAQQKPNRAARRKKK